MKKLLLAVLLVGGVVALASSMTSAQVVVPSVTLSQSEGPPGFQFTITVNDCVPDEAVRFSVGFPSEDSTCGESGTATSGVFSAPNSPSASDGAVAFVRLGDGPAFDLCDESGSRPCSVTAPITVLPPSLSVSPTSGAPGFEFTMTLQNCGTQFFQPASVTTADNGQGQDVVFVLPETGQEQEAFCPQPAGTVTSGTFTAPDEPGTYPVYGFLPDPGFLEFSLSQVQLPVDCATLEDPFGCGVFGQITVTADTTATDPTTTTEPPTPTTAPTTDAPVTTTAPTTAPAEAPAATTAAPTDPAAPPAEDADAVPPAPVVELPATGSSGGGPIGLLAVFALILGGTCAAIARRSVVTD